jgi:hypothetical protein
VTWIAWLNFVAYPVVLGVVVATATAWLLRRSIGARLKEIEVELALLVEQLDARRESSGQDLLEDDPQARYRRRPVVGPAQDRQ